MVSNISYFHPDPWGDDPIWRSYFSNGWLKIIWRFWMLLFFFLLKPGLMGDVRRRFWLHHVHWESIDILIVCNCIIELPCETVPCESSYSISSPRFKPRAFWGLCTLQRSATAMVGCGHGCCLQTWSLWGCSHGTSRRLPQRSRRCRVTAFPLSEKLTWQWKNHHF